MEAPICARPPLSVPRRRSSPPRRAEAGTREVLGCSVFLHVDWDFKGPVRPGDEITAEVEVLEARDDKPLTKLRTTITNQEGTIVLDGSASFGPSPSKFVSRGSRARSRSARKVGAPL
jgi:hypothetical protein